MKIAIIGGGIAGLTAAIALKRQGVHPIIYEGADEIKPVGAGVLIANNAMQILQRLGIHRQIEKNGMKISSINITDPKLHTLSKTDLYDFEEEYGVYNVAIHRADLLAILANHVGSENIKLSKRLKKIESENNFELIFEDGTTAHADAIIGADGIKSVVRDQLFGTGTIRDSKQRCWRGVTVSNWARKYDGEAFEAWGKGKRFGFAKISERTMYWYAVVNESLLKNRSDLSDLFKEFHPDITRLISETANSELIFNDLVDLEPFKKWADGNVCLIGDAAHATTPNMGQGACQAMEDAYTIGSLFQTGKATSEIFAQFETMRIKKAHTIVNASWKLGNVASLENTIAIWLRNTILRRVPRSVNKKQLAKLFDLSYLKK